MHLKRLIFAAAVGTISFAWAADVATPAKPPAIPRFVEETDTAGLQSRFEGTDEYMVGGGVATFDCDNDGLPEIYVTAGVNRATFYRNKSTKNGLLGGALKLVEERSGLELTNAVGAYPLDIDGDGQTDLVVLRVGEVQVFKGLGQCKFERANNQWNISTGNGWHTAFSATWEKNQTWPTLAFGTYTDRNKPDFPWGSCTPALLFRPKTGGGYLPPSALTPGHCALSMLFSDWNRFGTASLRVSNDREYYKGGAEQLWKMNADKSPNTPSLFSTQDGWKPLQIWGMGIASHDITGDGYPEVFLTSMSDNKLQVLDAPSKSNPQPKYVDIAYKRGVTAHRPYVGGDVHPSTAWHAQFADVNNDGLADLFIVKGNVSTMPDFAALDPSNLLLQQKDGRFFEAGHLSGIASFKRGRGGMLVDLNGDGLLDALQVNRWDKAQVWRQLPTEASKTNHWLQIRLQQNTGNRDAVGAWVEVKIGDKIIRQELTVGGGHASGHMGWMHFGLGNLGATTDLQVRVQWPQTRWGEWMSVKADDFYVISAQNLTKWKSP
jgi:hypothetical protein